MNATNPTTSQRLLAFVPFFALAAGPSTAAEPDTDAPPDDERPSARARLEPIDLATLPAEIAETEQVDLADIRSGVVCRRVRVIYSLIPRTFCTTTERLRAVEGRSNRDRVTHDIQTLEEILRYQMRNQRRRR
jgi:hypothetical protein